jgi:hypothetical protein
MFRYSPLEMEEMQKQITQLLLRGYIQPSSSPFGQCSSSADNAYACTAQLDNWIACSALAAWPGCANLAVVLMN